MRQLFLQHYHNHQWQYIHGTAHIADDTQPGGQCYWCLAGGNTAAGNCKRGYAGCTQLDEKYISVGTSVGGYRCESTGFCRTSCDDVSGEHWDTIDAAEGVEALYKPSGCRCTEFTPDTRYVRCAAGYYGTPDKYVYTGCTRCPKYTNMAGESFYGDSDPADNENIANCWLDGENGPFSDSTGEYDITTDKCAYVPYTIIPPGGGTVVTPPGGTIITPVD